jgi:D-alanine-D-alanine ligase
VNKLDKELSELGFKPVKELTDPRVAWTWSNLADFADGTLFVGHLDVPLELNAMAPADRREPEWIYGEGFGSSRAPLVAMTFALRALRRVRRLRQQPIGVLYYGDEGRDCRYSAEIIRQAMARAKHVLVLRPGNVGDNVVTARRGQRRYRVTIQSDPVRLGQSLRSPEALPWAFEKLQACARLSSKKERVAVATLDLRTTHMPMLLPHEVTCTLLVSYPDERDAERIEQQVRTIMSGKGVRSKIELISSRPPMKERRANGRLAKLLSEVASQWEIPLKRESSVWPSVAGLAPASTGVVCGVGPVARGIYTPDESVDRISVVQRTMLLAGLLVKNGK